MRADALSKKPGVDMPPPAATAQPEAEKRVDLTKQGPSQPPRDTSSTMRSKVAGEQNLAKQNLAERQALHARYAEKFPELAKFDPKVPLGAQLSDLSGPRLKPDDVPPGSFIICAERDVNNPALDGRKLTFWLQAKSHNSLPGSWGDEHHPDFNQGDYRNAHVTIKTADPATPHEHATEAWGKGQPPFVEGRGAFVPADPKEGRNFEKPMPGLAKGDVNRVQPTAGNLAALTKGGNKVFVPKDPEFGRLMAQFARIWAEGASIEYSKKELSSGGTGDYRMNAQSKQEAVKLAEGAFNPVQEWALNPVNRHDDHRNGVNCGSAAVRIAQAAMAWIERAREAANGNPNATFEDAVERFTGVAALTPQYVSPRTFEHFLLTGKDAKGEPMFEFAGILDDEVKFDETLPPPLPKQLDALPEGHPETLPKRRAKL